MLILSLVVKENLSAMVLSLAKRAAREILAMDTTDTILATKPRTVWTGLADLQNIL
jgi:hypothetical protein